MIDTEALRRKVIDLAMQGKLTQQLPEDGNAEDLYTQIQEERTRLIKEGKIKKEKPLPEISDDEIPFEIPSNWKWCRLGEVYCVLMGQSPDGMNVGIDIDGIEFHQGKIYFGEKYLNQSEQKTCELTRIANANSVLLCVRAPVGVVNITERQICIGRGLCALTAIAGMEPLYLFYYLLSCRKSFEQSGTGSTFSSITVDVVKKHIVPLPPIEEQRRIVGLLDKIFNQFTVIDDLQQEFESNREILKGKIIDAGIRGKLTEQLPGDGNADDLYAQIQEEKVKLIKEGKIKKEKPLPDISDDEILFEIPSNWKWMRIADVVMNSLGGGTPSKNIPEYWNDGDIPWISVKDFSSAESGYLCDTIDHITQDGLDNSASNLIDEDAIVICMRMALGKIVRLSRPMAINQDLRAIWLYECINESYFVYFYSTLKIVGRGTTVSGIRKEELMNYLIPLPPIEEQKRIVSIIELILNQLAT